MPPDRKTVFHPLQLRIEPKTSRASATHFRGPISEAFRNQLASFRRVLRLSSPNVSPSNSRSGSTPIPPVWPRSRLRLAPDSGPSSSSAPSPPPPRRRSDGRPRARLSPPRQRKTLAVALILSAHGPSPLARRNPPPLSSGGGAETADD